MNKLSLSLLAISSAFLMSCGGETAPEEEAPVAPVQKATEKVCTFSYDHSSSKITWTAFKTTARVAVGGAFDEFMVENTVESNSETAIFQDATFTINTQSTNSNNEDRDAKIFKFFYSNMLDSEVISGGVKKISEAVDGKGSAIIYITMNGITKDVNAVYTLHGTELNLTAKIDVNEWEGQEGIAALNKECEVLHTGDDGVSKLWSEVEIGIYTNLAKSCE